MGKPSPLSPSTAGKLCQSESGRNTDDESLVYGRSAAPDTRCGFPGGETVRRRPVDGPPGLLRFLPDWSPLPLGEGEGEARANSASS